jgi:GTP-binding protein
MDAKYLTSAAKMNQLPNFDLPELAFIGRSNVGKSSLLNALMQRKNLARTSATPGRTQMINFFELNGKLIFADLPGYGFHEAPTEIRKHWHSLMDSYCERPNIKGFLYLLDIRRDTEDYEFEFMSQLSKFAPIVVVYTKSDKLGVSDFNKRKSLLVNQFMEMGVDHEGIFAVSVLKNGGIDSLREEIFRLAFK